MFISMASDTEKVLELFSQLIKDDELLEDWLYFNEYIIMKCVLGFQSVINSLYNEMPRSENSRCVAKYLYELNQMKSDTIGSYN